MENYLNSLFRKGLAAFFTLLAGASLATVNVPETQQAPRPNTPPVVNPSPNRNMRVANCGIVVADCQTPQARAELSINNVRAGLLTGGDLFWDGVGLPKYEVPKVNNPNDIKRHSIFAASIWLGGYEAGTGDVIVQSQTYRQGQFTFWTGPIDQSESGRITSRDRCEKWDKMFKIDRRKVLEFLDQWRPGIRPEEIDPEILFWPGRSNPNMVQSSEFLGIENDFNLAKFNDVNGDGIYDPVDGDFPLLPGTDPDPCCGRTEINPLGGSDQCVWWVMNDVGNVKRYPSPPLMRPIGLEIQVEAFQYAASDPTNNMTFLRQTIINKGCNTMNDCYLGQWVDPDLGNFNDDYVGSDVMRGLGYCYNGDDFDETALGYGDNPPTVGVDYFRGAFPDPNDGVDNDRDGQIDEPCEAIGITNFVYYNNNNNPKNGNPTNGIEYNNLLRSRWRDGTLVAYDNADGTGPAPSFLWARFMFPGDSDPFGLGCGFELPPNNGACGPLWDEFSVPNPVGDRRFIVSGGSFTLKPGAINELTVGIVWARASSGGARGSLGLLREADDLAQERFDNCFKRFVGPNSPNLEITEMDGRLIFHIVEDTISRRPIRTTETYLETDRNVTLLTGDTSYRFQGYVIYQLADATVTVGELDNPDRARLLEGDLNGDGTKDFDGIMDRVDGISNIINREYDASVDQTIPVLKVRGEDKGIFKSFVVNKDMFNTERESLTNFNRYYYLIIAYANLANSNTDRPYLQGTQNVKVFTGTPHKHAPEATGTTIQSLYGQTPAITRITGTGTGFVPTGFRGLELEDDFEEKILAENSVQQITYKSGFGPLNIKVVDPKRVTKGDFKFKMISRLRYNRYNSRHEFKRGDQITGTFTGTNIGGAYGGFPQIPGEAVVVDDPIFVSDSLIDLPVQVTNADKGGTFSVVINVTSAGRFDRYDYQPISFSLRGAPALSARAVEFVENDFWELTETTTGKVYFSDRPASSISEQIIPEYGISIRVSPGRTPGELVYDPPLSRLVRASIEWADPSKAWLLPHSNSAQYIDTLTGALLGRYNWVRTDNTFTGKGAPYPGDPEGQFASVLDGAFAPWAGAKAFNRSRPNESGPAYQRQQRPGDPNFDLIKDEFLASSMLNVHNIDLVITSDKSKWSRCGVIQLDDQTNDLRSGSTRDIERLFCLKSQKPSIDKEGNPEVGKRSPFQSDSISKGMSWFPGYAIDIDRGIRLNLMFSENKLADTLNGNDLKWQPLGAINTPIGNLGASSTAGCSFIYVMNSQYDEGRIVEYLYDSLYLKEIIGDPAMIAENVWVRKYKSFYENLGISWVGGFSRLQRIQGIRLQNTPWLQSDLRVKLRVTRTYNTYPENKDGQINSPEYGFTTEGLDVIRTDKAAAKTALDLIRIVPNPYYGYSAYESSQVDNRVKIVNLPTKCVVSIYSVGGSLIRRFKIDQTNVPLYAAVENGVRNNSNGSNTVTYQDWDLRNAENIPVASGTYIIHVNGYDLGEKTLKWFGVTRPLDLDSF